MNHTPNPATVLMRNGKPYTKMYRHDDGAPLDALPDPDLPTESGALRLDPLALNRRLDEEYERGFHAALLCCALILGTIVVGFYAVQYLRGVAP